MYSDLLQCQCLYGILPILLEFLDILYNLDLIVLHSDVGIFGLVFSTWHPHSHVSPLGGAVFQN